MRPAWFLALAAALFTAAASAQILTGTSVRIPAEPLPQGPGTLFYNGLPPAGYDGVGTFTVVFAFDIAALCGAPKGYTVSGCVRLDAKGKPVIYVEGPLRRALAGDLYARLLIHEIAHAQGWPADHPMERAK